MAASLTVQLQRLGEQPTPLVPRPRPGGMDTGVGMVSMSMGGVDGVDVPQAKQLDSSSVLRTQTNLVQAVGGRMVD